MIHTSILYSTITQAWSDNVFKFAIIAEHLLLKVMEFIFTMSISSSLCYWSVSWSMLFIFLFSLTSADLDVVVGLPTHCVLLSIGWASSEWMDGTTVTTFLFHGHSDLCSKLYLNLPLYLSPHTDFVKVFCFT